MWLSDLALSDFRSYPEAVLAFEPGITAFIGENGQGKTNLVEAIAYLATLSSHRVAADQALVRLGGGAAVVRAKAREADRSSVLEVEILAGRANRARLNRGSVKPRELLGILRAVVFAPEDLILVSGDPSERRRFLNDIAVQALPRMAGVKADYDKITRQRAALLKESGMRQRRGESIDEVSLGVWNDRLAETGAQIVAHRARLVRALRPHVTECYAQIAPGRGTTHVAYRANVDDRSRDIPGPVQLEESSDELLALEEELFDVGAVRDRLAAEMERMKAREIERGVNLVGPHRDDLMLGLGKLPARGFASHGETWSYALALRLASWHLLKEDGTSDPLLILDDVFAELDVNRRARLAELIAPIEQVFITVAVGDDIPEGMAVRTFTVADGTVRANDR